MLIIIMISILILIICSSPANKHSHNTNHQIITLNCVLFVQRTQCTVSRALSISHRCVGVAGCRFSKQICYLQFCAVSPVLMQQHTFPPQTILFRWLFVFKIHAEMFLTSLRVFASFTFNGYNSLQWAILLVKWFGSAQLTGNLPCILSSD